MLCPRMRPAFRLGRKPLPLLCAALFASLVACESKPIIAPANLVIAAREPARPKAPVRSPNAPPHIVRIWMSTLTLRPGMWFDGTIVASTNVASVEVRTAAFSINSAHVAPGFFRFHALVLEVPALSRLRSYELYVIARNTAGEQEVENATLSLK
jgi:hypothetical protein